MCANENKDMKHSACATRSIKGPRSPVNELRYRRRCTSGSCQRFRLHAGAATRLKRCTSPTLSLRLMHLKVWRARRTHEIEHCCQHGSSTPATKKNRHVQNVAAFTFALVDLSMCSTPFFTAMMTLRAAGLADFFGSTCVPMACGSTSASRQGGWKSKFKARNQP